jgi:hypothetical protein
MGMDVAQLAPHAGLPSDHFYPFNSGVETIEISPFNVISVWDAVSIAEALVDVCVVVG